jgi:hypothetical protein
MNQMNQEISSTVSKRVPSQPHLTLHAQPTYEGLHVLNCPGGMVSKYLERWYCTLNHATTRYSKVFAVRVDLQFPRRYSSTGFQVLSNEYLHVFIKSLRHRLKQHRDQKKRSGQHVYCTDFYYLWAREYGSDSDRPHFHLILLFNGHAFNSLGHFSNEQESMYNRIGESWADALGFHVAEGVRFVHFPEDSQYVLDSRDQKQLAQVFYRGSYLTKVATKNFHDGLHVFGGSRI